MPLLLALFALAAASVPPAAAAEAAAGAEAPAGAEALAGAEAPAGRSYLETLAAWEAEGVRATEGVRVAIDGLAWSAASPGAAAARSGIGGRSAAVLVWEREDTWIEWTFSVPVDGLYTIAVEYYPLPGRRGAVQRQVRIDGELPFREANSLLLPRLWRDEGPPRKDNRGNDVQPRQIEAPAWRIQVLEDPIGVPRGPLRFRLSAGRHALRLAAVKEPVAIARIVIASPVRLPSYAEVAAEYARKGYRAARDAFVKIQAERPEWKTDPSVRMASSPDLRADPPAGTRRVFNTFGSYRWRWGSQAVSWRFTIEQAGLYRISMKAFQNFKDGLPSVRRIAIDGEVPFAELEEVSFPFSRQQQLVTLGDGSTPYLFWFEPGEHTIQLSVTTGEVRSVIGTIERAVQELSRLQRKVMLVTGVNPDPNREWDDLPVRIPDLLPTLRRMADDLDRERAVLVRAAGGGRPPMANTLAFASDQFRSLADRFQTIPYRLGNISDTVTNLANWLIDLKDQPLELDWFAVSSPDAALPSVRAGFFEQVAAAWNSFIASFTNDYAGVGNVYAGGGERVLTVWIARPREYVEIIKEMADEDFTVETGVRVNVSVIPVDQMQAILLNALVGTAPDVALGIDANLPFDLGVRGALADLNDFPDYGSVAARFRPGALVPYRFRGADWALPETQGFSMLFYRTDLFGELGLEPPDTWDDVYAMLPTLQKNGMNFGYEGVASIPGLVSPGLLPFLLQRGGRFYNDENLSALDEPEALAAFRQWTELYTNWRVPLQANFYNQFRTGDLPIGISDYSSYVQFHTAAPELSGWWRMTPLPGIRRADGTVDRSAGGASKVAILFAGSRLRDEGWRFMKWWTSAEVQTRFGEELEALIGTAARWNTANVEALTDLPWPNEDIAAILEQWTWFKEQPAVPGGYFTEQHVKNAMYRVVDSGMNPRESLEIAVEDINRELRRKQAEFGMVPPPSPSAGLRADLEAAALGRSR